MVNPLILNRELSVYGKKSEEYICHKTYDYKVLYTEFCLIMENNIKVIQLNIDDYKNQSLISHYKHYSPGRYSVRTNIILAHAISEQVLHFNCFM